MIKNFLKKTFRKKRSKKGVVFQSRITVHQISHHEQAENDELWYSSHDAKLIQSGNNKILEMMKSETQRLTIEEQGECTRGLESRQRENKRRTSMRRKESYAVVFAKQQVQMMQGSYKPESIATFYSNICKAAAEDALEMARLDEKYVRECALEDLSEHLLATIKGAEDKSNPLRKTMASLSVSSRAPSLQDHKIRPRI
jgi:hypothetical protein